MSSLSRMLGGRKKESRVWDYYVYCEAGARSRCVVVDAKTTKACGVLIAGKNSTNLTAHLRRFHKEQHEELLIKMSEAQSTKKRPAAAMSSSVQTLQECMSRSSIAWPSDSFEHKRRLETIIDLLADTGYPVTMLDRPSFRDLVKTLDAKFKLPG